MTARLWFSPQATLWTFIFSKQITLLGTVTSELVDWEPDFSLVLSSKASYMSSTYVSSPSCPKSFIPHPYSSPSCVLRREKAAPQNTWTIFTFWGRYGVISTGMRTFDFDRPTPGSKESALNPKPNYPYIDMPHPKTFESFARTIEWVSPQAICVTNTPFRTRASTKVGFFTQSAWAYLLSSPS